LSVFGAGLKLPLEGQEKVYFINIISELINATEAGGTIFPGAN
jgi:hypothetical protein